MAGTAITPTRMVLNQLKGRLKTARRGHKLLKDKRDELMRQFMDVVKLNKQLRIRVEEGLTQAFASQQVASSILSPEILEQALLYPRQSVDLGMTFKNIMSVNVPQYSFHTKIPRRSIPTALPRPRASWTTRWTSWRACLRTCWSWHRSRRRCSCWPRRSRRRAGA